MHEPYEEILNRKADFKVTYSIISQEEGGRYNPVYQGIRWNFWYEHPEHQKAWQFIIWPEFEDAQGNVITETDIPLAKYGIAGMWIINHEWIDYHRGKIKVGTHGFFMEGSRKVGECDVIELINLK